MQEAIQTIWTTQESHLCVGGTEMSMQVLVAFPRTTGRGIRLKGPLRGSCFLLPAMSEGMQLYHNL